LKPLDWTPAFAGETNLRRRPFSSFRRKPESSGIKEEFDVYTIMALLVILQFTFISWWHPDILVVSLRPARGDEGAGRPDIRFNEVE